MHDDSESATVMERHDGTSTNEAMRQRLGADIGVCNRGEAGGAAVSRGEGKHHVINAGCAGLLGGKAARDVMVEQSGQI